MSEGPISAEQVRDCVRFHNIEPFNTNAVLNEEATACELNALIRPLIESAVASAQAEMRERCAKAADPVDDVLANVIRKEPLSPASDAWLRRVVKVAMRAERRYREALEELSRRNMAWHKKSYPSKPTYESILAEAAKEKP